MSHSAGSWYLRRWPQNKLEPPVFFHRKFFQVVHLDKDVLDLIITAILHLYFNFALKARKRDDITLGLSKRRVEALKWHFIHTYQSVFSTWGWVTCSLIFSLLLPCHHCFPLPVRHRRLPLCLRPSCRRPLPSCRHASLWTIRKWIQLLHFLPE